VAPRTGLISPAARASDAAEAASGQPDRRARLERDPPHGGREPRERHFSAVGGRVSAFAGIDMPPTLAWADNVPWHENRCAMQQ